MGKALYEYGLQNSAVIQIKSMHDEQEEAWRWVEPIMEHWRADERGPRSYAAGTWGPSASSAMIARDGHCWSEEC